MEHQISMHHKTVSTIILGLLTHQWGIVWVAIIKNLLLRNKDQLVVIVIHERVVNQIKKVQCQEEVEQEIVLKIDKA
jgi:hypothetical protein